MARDHGVYNRIVVQGLTIEHYGITAREHFGDESPLPLREKMFRFGAEHVSRRIDDLSYSLVSSTPTRKNSVPGSDLEREGLEYVGAYPWKALLRRTRTSIHCPANIEHGDIIFRMEICKNHLGADPILTMEIGNLPEIVRVYTTLCR